MGQSTSHLTAGEVLGEDGPLSQALPGFRVRPAQQAMAEAITTAIADKVDLLVEAGTGTGKTLAYLVPAIYSGLKVIISTGTKNLQDQLIHRDVPLLRNALQLPVTFAALKGRANYLCLHRFEQAQQDSSLDRRQHNLLKTLHAWSAGSKRGDIAECDALPENDPFWPKVTSTTDNCLGQACDHYEKCYLVKARREAQAADIVIINHYLLMSDIALQESGFGELLPAADAYIIDEAHQLPDIASQFFGVGVSTAQFHELAADCVQAYRQDINENDKLINCADQVSRASTQVRNLFGPSLRRASWTTMIKDKAIHAALAQLNTAMLTLNTELTPLAERSRDLATCRERAHELQQRLLRFSGQLQPGHVHWFEVHRRSVTFHLTPLDIAEPFIAHKQRKQGVWIFTSATLTVANQFVHFTSRLGLHQARCLRWDSPFDYEHNTLLYLPPQMPDPNEPEYTTRVVELASRVLRASHGRAFLLFTSHRALQEASRLLKGMLPYPLLIQGDSSRDALLDKFRHTPNAVLLATSSFWEGVDVRGEALSCVIIDKLPFATPDDPVLQARIEAMRANGQNPFMDYQLPAAVIALKQGAGRLIRDYNDRGVLVLCDPRLRSKPYGKLFLQSLPAMPITQQEQAITGFFAHDTPVVGAVS